MLVQKLFSYKKVGEVENGELVGTPCFSYESIFFVFSICTITVS